MAFVAPYIIIVIGGHSMSETVEISNQEKLFEAIAKIANNEWPKNIDIMFVGWPKFEITIKGEDFKGGIPTRVLPFFVELQNTVEQTHKLISSEKDLSKEDLKKLELIINVRPGSSRFETELFNLLNQMLANASSDWKTLAVLLIAGVWTIGKIWRKHYLDKITAQVQADRHEEHMQLLKTLAELISSNPNIDDQKAKNIEERISEVGNKKQVEKTLGKSNKFMMFMTQIPHKDDKILMNNEQVLDSQLAEKLTHKEEPIKVDEVINSTFIILSVHSRVIKEGYRAEVRNEITKEKLSVEIYPDKLSQNEIDLLQQCEWGKTSLRMAISLSRTGKKVSNAKLLSVYLHDNK